MAIGAAAAFSAPALATTSVCTAPTSANSAACAGLAAMRELNVITFGNLTSQSEAEGKVWIGGNQIGSLTAAKGGSGTFTQGTRAQLTIGGNAESWKVETALGMSKVQANIGGNSTGEAGMNAATSSTPGNVKTGGTFNSQGFNPTSYKTATTGAGSTFKSSIATSTSTLSTNLKALSTSLKAMTATNITNFSTPLVVSSNATYAVFNMSEALFEDQNANFDNLFTSSTIAGKTIIINVAGTNLVESGNINNKNIVQNVIWNFADATTLSLKGWEGSVLAPKATLTTSSAVEGSVVAQVFNMGGEVHLGTFNGTDAFLATGGGSTPVGNVPEPASWMTMMMGFGIIGSIVRRRRRQERLAA